MNVREYILNELNKKHKITDTAAIANLNYVEEGYVDSLGLIQFVYGIEEEFQIEFTDEELASSHLQVVGELIAIIEEKIKQKYTT